MSRDELKARIDRYPWYHEIEVSDGIRTSPAGISRGFKPIWDFALAGMRRFSFEGKRVLDIGCRDGLFSFEAERSGAREIVAFDNDLSHGATELLIPLLRSRVRMFQRNLYEVDREEFGEFDVILCFGVLYHLRFPVFGLHRMLRLLAPGGVLLIESGMVTDPRFAQHELIYCPVARSPYEPTCCTFFTPLALTVTAESLGSRVEYQSALAPSDPVERWRFAASRRLRRAVSRVRRDDYVETNRCFFALRKVDRPDLAFAQSYWLGTHTGHTRDWPAYLPPSEWETWRR